MARHQHKGDPSPWNVRTQHCWSPRPGMPLLPVTQLESWKDIAACLLDSTLPTKEVAESKQQPSQMKTQRLSTKKTVTHKETVTFRSGGVGVISQPNSRRARPCSAAIGPSPEDASKKYTEMIDELRHYRTAVSGGQIVVARSMTSELKSALERVRDFAQIDDLYQREIEAVFAWGGEVYCEIQPHGNSEQMPVLQLLFPNGHRKIWYPEDGVSPAEKERAERQQDGIECGVVRAS